MADVPEAQVEEVLNRFAEAMFRMMVDRFQKYLNELDLTMVQAQVLRLLHPGSLSTGELAGELGISAPAVTQLTNRLIRKRLIERRTAFADRRSVMVLLTPKGKRAIDRFRDKRGDVLRVALNGLAQGERAEVMAALAKVLAAIEGSGGRAAQGDRQASNQNGREASSLGRDSTVGQQRRNQW